MLGSIKLSDLCLVESIDVQLSEKELRRLAKYLRNHPDEAGKQPEIDFSAIKFGIPNVSLNQTYTEQR